MKILLSVTAFLPHSFGGGQVYVYRVARALRELGHEAAVLTAAAPGDPEDGQYEYEGVPVLTFRPDPEDWRARFTGESPRTVQAIARRVRAFRPEIVHLNGWKPAAASACRELGIPHVVTAHHAGIACPAGTLVTPRGTFCDLPMSTGACVPCVSRSRRPRLGVGRALGMIPPGLFRPLGRWLNRSKRLSYAGRGLIYPWLVDEAIRAKQGVLQDRAMMIAPSLYMRDLLLRNGRSAESVAVVPHTIEPLARTPMEPFDGRPVRLGYVGRIEPLKGLSVLLEALAGVHDAARCELHVYGAARTPWDEDALRRALGAYRGAAGVSLHGRVEPGALGRAYASFDALVVPSMLPEAFGLVVLEAFSAGRPVIVFPSGALPELVRDGVDGIVVGRPSAAALAAVLERVLAAPALLTRLAEGIPAPRSMRSHADALLEIYGRALGAAGSSAQRTP